jgi:hypothetical protein
MHVSSSLDKKRRIRTKGYDVQLDRKELGSKDKSKASTL